MMMDKHDDEMIRTNPAEPLPSAVTGPDQTDEPETEASGQDEASADLEHLLQVYQELARRLHRQFGSGGESEEEEEKEDEEDEDREEEDEDDEDEEDEEEDEEEEDEEDEEDEDEDDEDEEDDEDDEEDEDEDEEEGGRRHKDSGKQVILRRDFKSSNAYFLAVSKCINRFLRRHGEHPSFRPLRDGVFLYSFDASCRGVDVDGYVLIEREICNYRIEFQINTPMRPGRTVLLDGFLAEKCYPLRYGKLIFDHSDDERKIENSVCFYDAFSEAAFERYFIALTSTLQAYLEDIVEISSRKTLSEKYRRQLRSSVLDIAASLPARVKPDKEECYRKILAALGGDPSPKIKKLAAFLAEHSKG